MFGEQPPDPYGTERKQIGDDETVNMTDGVDSNSSQVHYEPVLSRKKEKLRKKDSMTDTNRKSVATAAPNE